MGKAILPFQNGTRIPVFVMPVDDVTTTLDTAYVMAYVNMYPTFPNDNDAPYYVGNGVDFIVWDKVVYDNFLVLYGTNKNNATQDLRAAIYNDVYKYDERFIIWVYNPFRNLLFYNTLSTTAPVAGQIVNVNYLDPVPGVVQLNDTNAYYFLNSLILTDEYPDDVFPGDTSGTGGGTGNYDGTGENVPFEPLPGVTATSAGFITMYVPSLAQLNSLANYMWTTDFYENVKKLFGDPMDAILGLSIVPVSPAIAGTRAVSVGNVSTGVSMPYASSQYVSVDCGTLNIQEYWGSALDYSPYTKIQIYLPYIGTHELNTDDVMKKSVHVKYNVDALSGALTAQIMCAGSVLYQFSGSCASAMPISGRDFTQVIMAGISAIGTASMIAAGAMSAPITAAMAVSGVMTTANNVMNAKPRIEHSGAMGGTAGLMGLQTPYLIIERPRQSLAGQYNTFVGYPSNITAELGDLTGYTEIEKIHITNINATENELNEIENLLKGGVIL